MELSEPARYLVGAGASCGGRVLLLNKQPSGPARPYHPRAPRIHCTAIQPRTAPVAPIKLIEKPVNFGNNAPFKKSSPIKKPQKTNTINFNNVPAKKKTQPEAAEETKTLKPNNTSNEKETKSTTPPKTDLKENTPDKKQSQSVPVKKKSNKLQLKKYGNKNKTSAPVRKRIRVIDSDDSCDEPDDIFNQDSPEEIDYNLEEEIPPTPSQSLPEPKVALNPKKRKIDKVFTDDDGYIRTVKNVYESCSDKEESETEKPAKITAPVEPVKSPEPKADVVVKKNNSNKSAKANKKLSPTNQRSIMSFFGKKS